MKDADGCISRDKLLEHASRTDVFLTHDWGYDQYGRDNHKRVLRLNEALKKMGIVTWFDKDRMENGDIIEQMSNGIENTQYVVTFITQRYLQKVGSTGNDNCKFEFKYAVRKVTADKMLAVVMEERCTNPNLWKGLVGMTLGGNLFSDYISDDNFRGAVFKIYNAIVKNVNTLLGANCKEAIRGISNLPKVGAPHSPVPVPPTLSVPAISPAPSGKTVLSSVSSKSNLLQISSLPELVPLEELTVHQAGVVICSIVGNGHGLGETVLKYMKDHNIKGSTLKYIETAEDLVENKLVYPNMPKIKIREFLGELKKYREDGVPYRRCAEQVAIIPPELARDFSRFSTDDGDSVTVYTDDSAGEVVIMTDVCGVVLEGMKDEDNA